MPANYDLSNLSIRSGRYRNEHCAVKLIFTMDLTVEVIRRVAAEAELLSSLNVRDDAFAIFFSRCPDCPDPLPIRVPMS